MAANGISTLRAGKRNAKGKRQIAKLKLAEAKRQGRVIVEGDPGNVLDAKYGVWNHSGAIDSGKSYYRAHNICHIYRLPTRYGIEAGADMSLVYSDIVDHGNAGWATLTNRPWKDTGATTI